MCVFACLCFKRKIFWASCFRELQPPPHRSECHKANELILEADMAIWTHTPWWNQLHLIPHGYIVMQICMYLKTKVYFQYVVLSGLQLMWITKLKHICQQPFSIFNVVTRKTSFAGKIWNLYIKLSIRETIESAVWSAVFKFDLLFKSQEGL